MTFATSFGAFVTGSTPVYDTITVYSPSTPWDAASNTPGAPAWFTRGGFSVPTLAGQVTPELPACTSVDTP